MNEETHKAVNEVTHKSANEETGVRIVRRALVRKAAYVVPLILAAVEASARPKKQIPSS